MKKLILILILLVNFVFVNNVFAFNNVKEINQFKAKILEVVDAEKFINYKVSFLDEDKKTFKNIKVEKDFGLVTEQFSKGDLVLLEKNNINSQEFFVIKGYWYFDKIVFWFFVLIITMFIVAKKETIKNLLSLFVSFVLIFGVFIFLVKHHFNPFYSALFISIMVSFFSIIFLSGWSKKSFISILGTISGLVFATILSYVMIESMHISGLGSDDSIILKGNFPDINIEGIFFAGVILGALGATMDTAISISASVSELHKNNSNLSFKQLFKSGMNVGMDIIGSMLHTLIFAYMGTSITFILLFSFQDISIVNFFNIPFIAEEVVRSIAGSIGLISCIPWTAFFAARFYSRK